MPTVTFDDEGTSGEFEPGTRLLDCAKGLGIRISNVCGGDGSCGTCRIEVIEGDERLTPPTPDETSKDIEAPYRLSCQARLLGDVIVRVAKIE